ncbi:MAG: DUF2232 domain-containing protein [Alphaproteobacteria bacterium]
MPPRQNLLIPIGAGAISALAYLVAAHGVGFGVLTGYFGTLPLFIAGLALGVPAAAIATASSLVLAALGASIAVAAVFAAAYLLPPLLLVRQALLGRPDSTGGVEWYPPGMLLAWTAAIGSVLFVAAALLLSVQADGLIGTIETYVGMVWDTIVQGEAEERRSGFIQAVVPLLPGAIVASWIAMMVVNGCLAQSLLVRMGRNLRPTPAYSALELPAWLLPTLTIAAAAGLLLPGAAGYVGQNLAVILVAPFCFLGLAVVHVLCRRVGSGRLLLGMFYTMLVLLTWPVILLAGLGLMEPWLKLRKQEAGKSGPPATGVND